MGIFDIPACISHILNHNTLSKKIIYFGHSQGGTSILAGMCEQYDFYREQILLVILLAPASRIENIHSNLLQFLKNFDVDNKLNSKDINEIFPFDPDLIDLNIKINKVYPTFSHALLEMTSDEVSWVNCPDRIKVYFSHFPSGTSLKSITHFKQIIESKKFQKFDFGKEENLKIYKNELPLEYDLSKIKDIPIILCGGLNDKLTHINDIRWLKSQIEFNNTKFFSYYEFDYMGHASFLLNSNITWFNFILSDIYKIIKTDSSNNLTANKNVLIHNKEISAKTNAEDEKIVNEEKDNKSIS